MEDKRSAPRIRSFLKGRIAFSNGMSSMDCLVRNISPSGAKLHLTEGIALPEVFELHIPQRNETVRAQMRWRRGDEIGVLFLSGAGALAVQPVDAAERLREVEAENLRLRQTLAELKAALGADHPVFLRSAG